ncbi:hypothetical protein MRB53_022616 [Persea americana]|uniref:Uncharacterized protein n=1 Tax=Persea americana TaxID=3435 RepID=A0ACC2L8B8_PERAE|nr:hypothetical protein MRB53_022616 [Persea americana]
MDPRAWPLGTIESNGSEGVFQENFPKLEMHDSPLGDGALLTQSVEVCKLLTEQMSILKGLGFVGYRFFESGVLQMGCLDCIGPRRKDLNKRKIDDSAQIGSTSRFSAESSSEKSRGKGSAETNGGKNDSGAGGKKGRPAQSFTFRDLATATKNFRASNLIGEGGFGKVYKGQLESGEAVAIKQLNRDGIQGNQEFIIESRPFFRDRRKFVHMADPLLQGRYPLRCFHHAVAITAMCLQEQPTFRPLMGDVVVALEYLASQPYTSETGSGKHSPRSL